MLHVLDVVLDPFLEVRAAFSGAIELPESRDAGPIMHVFCDRPLPRPIHSGPTRTAPKARDSPVACHTPGSACTRPSMA